MTAQRKRGFYEKYIKRIFDIVLSGLALIILSPVIAIVALLVRVKLGSPVIFKQDRPGLNEKIFKMYKFRSMTDDRDVNGELLPDEDRLPSFGKKLRSTSLDELPELVNIFKGDMSIVGPRPPLVREVEQYNSYQMQRLLVTPGLTCFWQAYGRSNLSFDDWMDMDMKYIKRRNIFLDIKLIVKTVFAVIFKRGAY